MAFSAFSQFTDNVLLHIRAIYLVPLLRKAAGLCKQQSIWHCVEVKKGEHTVLPYGRKNLCRSLFSKRSPVSGLRQTKK